MVRRREPARAIWGVHPIDESDLFHRIFPIVQPKAKQKKKTDAMNAKNKSYEPKYATRNRAAVETDKLAGRRHEARSA